MKCAQHAVHGAKIYGIIQTFLAVALTEIYTNMVVLKNELTRISIHQNNEYIICGSFFSFPSMTTSGL